MLQALAVTPGATRRVAVLGEMLELGDSALATARSLRPHRAREPASICSWPSAVRPRTASSTGAKAGGLPDRPDPAIRRFGVGARAGCGPDSRRRPRADQGFARHAHGHHRRRARRGGRAGLMLLHLLYPLHDSFSIFNVFRYITFRTAGASLTAMALSLLLGPWLIRQAARRFRSGQVIRTDGPAVAQAESRHADDGRPADRGVGAPADAALGRSRRIRTSGSRAPRRWGSARSDSSTTTSRSRGTRTTDCSPATNSPRRPSSRSPSACR